MLMLLESHLPPPPFPVLCIYDNTNHKYGFLQNRKDKSGLIAAAPQTVSERRRCRCALPRRQEWASPSPALHRLNSLPLSLAADGQRRQNI